MVSTIQSLQNLFPAHSDLQKKKKQTLCIWLIVSKFPILGFLRNSKGILDFRLTDNEGLFHLPA